MKHSWLLILLMVATATGIAQQSMSLRAPDGTTVFITRDSYGVPHISGENEEAIFFAQGFAAAADRLYQMETFRRQCEGRLAELLGNSALTSDKQIRTVYYTLQERTATLNNLPSPIKQMFVQFTAGVNRYLDSMQANPQKYRPYESQTVQIKPWTVENSIAIAQFFIRQFGQFGGQEMTRLSEYLSNGKAWFDANRPINDPDVYTTIPKTGGTPRQRVYHGPPIISTDLMQSVIAWHAEYLRSITSMGAPTSFGSFAAIIPSTKSQSGNVMLLGGPQMQNETRDQTSIVWEVELWSPSYHAGGMTIAGLPGIIVGRTERHAWSFTSGMSDNTDTFIDSLDATNTKYLFNGQWTPLQIFRDTIATRTTPVIFVHYRTVHGPVIALDTVKHTAASYKMTFWNDELSMAASCYGLVKVKSLSEFETELMRNPMSFNVFYAGDDQKIKYWHSGKYPVRPDSVDPRLPLSGTGAHEWKSTIPFSQLPQGTVATRGYYINWNNKPAAWWDHGDNTPWTKSSSAATRVELMENYFSPLASISFDQLKTTAKQINDRGTYEHAHHIAANGFLASVNVLPPGESGFIGLDQKPSPNKNDQWDLYTTWNFKDQLFGVRPVSVEHERSLPSAISVSASPNPSRDSEPVRFTIEMTSQGYAVLDIFTLLGQRVAHFRSDVASMRHTFEWRTVDASGTRLPAGSYLYRIAAGREQRSGYVTILR